MRILDTDYATLINEVQAASDTGNYRYLQELRKWAHEMHLVLAINGVEYLNVLDDIDRGEDGIHT